MPHFVRFVRQSVPLRLSRAKPRGDADPKNEFVFVARAAGRHLKMHVMYSSEVSDIPHYAYSFVARVACFFLSGAEDL